MTSPSFETEPQDQQETTPVESSSTPEPIQPPPFEHQTFVLYDGGGSRSLAETTLLYQKPGDGFEFGPDSLHSHARGATPFILRTTNAVYHYDTEVFARADANDGTVTAAYDSSILGKGFSGRIGEPVALPGATEPEIVTAVELRYRRTGFGSNVVHAPSPFKTSTEQLEQAHTMVETSKMLGRVAHK